MLLMYMDEKVQREFLYLWRKISHKNGKSVKMVGCHPISHALEGKSTKTNFIYGLISNGKKRTLSRDSLKRFLIWVL